MKYRYRYSAERTVMLEITRWGIYTTLSDILPWSLLSNSSINFDNRMRYGIARQSSTSCLHESVIRNGAARDPVIRQVSPTHSVPFLLQTITPLVCKNRLNHLHSGESPASPLICCRHASTRPTVDWRFSPARKADVRRVSKVVPLCRACVCGPVVAGSVSS